MAGKLTQPFAHSPHETIQYRIRRSATVNYFFYSQIALVLCWVYEKTSESYCLAYTKCFFCAETQVERLELRKQKEKKKKTKLLSSCPAYLHAATRINI